MKRIYQNHPTPTPTVPPLQRHPHPLRRPAGPLRAWWVSGVGHEHRRAAAAAGGGADAGVVRQGAGGDQPGEPDWAVLLAWVCWGL